MCAQPVDGLGLPYWGLSDLISLSLSIFYCPPTHVGNRVLKSLIVRQGVYGVYFGIIGEFI